MKKWGAILELEVRRMLLPVAVYLVLMAVPAVLAVLVLRGTEVTHPPSSWIIMGLLYKILIYAAPGILFLYVAITDHVSGKQTARHSLPVPAWLHLLVQAAVVFGVATFLFMAVIGPLTTPMFSVKSVIPYAYVTASVIVAFMAFFIAGAVVRGMPVLAGFGAAFLILATGMIYSWAMAGFHIRILETLGTGSAGAWMLLYLMDSLPALLTAVLALWLYNRFSEV